MALSRGFTDTMTAALADPATADYDDVLKAEVAAYAKRFRGTPDFPDPLDWRLFKAQLLIESGGPKGRVWKGRVMQIDNSGDPGLSVVRAAVRGDGIRVRHTPIEPEPKNTLRPRDIQARIRAGETPESVAQAAQTSVDKIMAFAAPVLAVVSIPLMPVPVGFDLATTLALSAMHLVVGAAGAIGVVALRG